MSVSSLRVVNNENIDCDKVLTEATGKLKDVLIIGRQHNGELYIASNTDRKSELLYLMEKFKFKMLNGDYG